jgi:hypothetical protein
MFISVWWIETVANIDGMSGHEDEFVEHFPPV